MLKFIYKISETKYESGVIKYPKIPKSKDRWVWIHLSNPTEKELAKVKSDFSIPNKILYKFFKEQRSVRYTFKPLTFGLVDYYVKNGKIGIEKILFLIGENYLITVTHTPLAHYDEIYKMILEKISVIRNVGYLFYEILDYDVEHNFDVLDISEKRITELEKKILNPEEIKRKITDIVDLKRDLTRMWRRFWRSSKIIFSIKKGLTPVKVEENLIRLLDDIHDTYIYQMEIVTAQKEVLTDALTIYESVLANTLAKISNRISVGLKKLTLIMFLWTAIATILAIPNTIATIFGIPDWPITVDMWQFLAFILLISIIIPIIWFYLYWKKIKTTYVNEKM